MKYNYEKIGERITKERKKYSLTQTKMIERLSRDWGIGINRNTLSAIENGKYDGYSMDLLFAFCDIFDCEIGYLLCEYDTKSGRITDVSEYTGLSYSATEKLIELKKYSSIISKIIESVNFESVLPYIKRFSDSSNLIVTLQNSIEKIHAKGIDNRANVEMKEYYEEHVLPDYDERIAKLQENVDKLKKKLDENTGECSVDEINAQIVEIQHQQAKLTIEKIDCEKQLRELVETAPAQAIANKYNWITKEREKRNMLAYMIDEKFRFIIQEFDAEQQRRRKKRNGKKAAQK